MEQRVCTFAAPNEGIRKEERAWPVGGREGKGLRNGSNPGCATKCRGRFEDRMVGGMLHLKIRSGSDKKFIDKTGKDIVER